MPVEEGDWKIPQGAALPGNLLHARPKRSFLIYINNRAFRKTQKAARKIGDSFL
jgi:hypothetical protein